MQAYLVAQTGHSAFLRQIRSPDSTRVGTSDEAAVRPFDAHASLWPNLQEQH